MPELHKAIVRLMAERGQEPIPYGDPPALRAIVDSVRNRLVADEQHLFAQFLRVLFAREGASLLDTTRATHLAGMALQGFRFVCSKGNQPWLLRIYVPDLERDGWATPHTVIETVMPDRRFIVDTLLESVRELGGVAHIVLHPILGINRSADGTVVEIRPPAGAAERESFVHIEAAKLPPSEELTRVLEKRVGALVKVTEDYAEMRRRVALLAAELRRAELPPSLREEVHEVAAFLDWLGQKNFIYLGSLEYSAHEEGGHRRLRPCPDSGLGVLRDATVQIEDLPALVEADRDACLIATTTQSVSPVHRLVPMQSLRVRRRERDGTVVAEALLLGLFTSKAYHEPPSTVPLLRSKLGRLLKEEGVVEDSHDCRNLIDLFDSIPKEQLLASTVTDIRNVMRTIMVAEGVGGIRVVAHGDTAHNGIFLTAILPRARFSTDLHERISAQISRRLQSVVLHQQIILDERVQARLHYLLALPAVMPDAPLGSVLERDLNSLLRTWEDQLREALAGTFSPAEADRLTSYYAAHLPPDYKARTPIEEVVADIGALERLLTTGIAQIELQTVPRKGTGAAALKLYLLGERVVLSEFIPLVENLALRVLDEEFVKLDLPGVGAAYIHAFQVEAAPGTCGSLQEAAPLLTSALRALRSGRIENDPLNKLVLTAGLDWRSVDLLRAYAEHARQMGVAGGRNPFFEALTAHPEVARLLLKLFAAKFDPAFTPLPAADRLLGPAAEAEAAFLGSLEGVDSLVHDRLLRALAASVAATVRTNFFSRPGDDEAGAAIALKIDCRRIPHSAEPRPMFETYVHAPGVEGSHLRVGLVARGGIRLSDRPDDFRSEILGLLRTQVVKNAVIVPVGAKGGFVVKGVRAGCRASPSAVEMAYRAFIGALLSVTDNLRGGRPAPAGGRLCYDGPDPYLVVAPDKGTAALSDVANAVAASYDHWLGDAFASGGTHGYDHKKIGITSRGAWECLRQHFREMGRQLDGETITVVGIGDMGGDVFGNGMLRSRKILLRAAFNHKHIFLDPDPDPEASYRERERLFHLPGSSWEDYDRSILSPGGGIFPRHAKAIPLSPEARAMLGLDAVAPTGEEVIRAILRMPVDVLWNGGVGTYVRASDESDAEVKDPANDAVRIRASELRANVVVEGGNLGFTQRARIEFALAGGRINTDAIDNSGGVDMSDHEVNLKIALAPALALGELSLDARNRLLEEVKEDVVKAVLSHNWRQARVLGIDQRRSRVDLAAFQDHIAVLEREGEIDRRTDQTPTGDALRARRSTFVGLTRPELALILAHTKLYYRKRLLASGFCNEPEVGEFFRSYFPATICERFASLVARHPLRQEITAVQLINSMVDSMGVTFATRLANLTGHDFVAIIRAWVAATGICAALPLIDKLDSLQPGLAGDAEAVCHIAIQEALERATKWILDTQGGRSVEDLKKRFAEPVRFLLAGWQDMLDSDAVALHRGKVGQFMALGLPERMAKSIVALESITEIFEIALLAGEMDVPLPVVTEAYLKLHTLVDFPWIRQVLVTLRESDDPWERRAVEGLLEGLMYARRELTREVLQYAREQGCETAASLDAYINRHTGQVKRLRSIIADLRALPAVPLARVLVVMRELGRLTDRTECTCSPW